MIYSDRTCNTECFNSVSRTINKIINTARLSYLSSNGKTLKAKFWCHKNKIYGKIKYQSCYVPRGDWGFDVYNHDYAVHVHICSNDEPSIHIKKPRVGASKIILNVWGTNQNKDKKKFCIDVDDPVFLDLYCKTLNSVVKNFNEDFYYYCLSECNRG